MNQNFYLINKKKTFWEKILTLISKKNENET